MTSTRGAEICARCARVGRCCCILTDDAQELCFPISELERQRIVEHGPKDRGGLCGQPNSAAFLDRLGRLFPKDRAALAKLFPPHGEHLRLATEPDGQCTFLTSAGCSLPREVRPYYCRLFPFWVSAGAVAAFMAKGCLAGGEGRTAEGTLSVMGVSRQTVRNLHGRLRMAWGLPPTDDGDLCGQTLPEVD